MSPSRKTIEELFQNPETIEGALVQISGLNLKDSHQHDIGQKQTFVILIALEILMSATLLMLFGVTNR